MLFASLAGLMLAGSSPLLAAPRVVGGKWEHTIVQKDGAATKFAVCMTDAEAASINGDTATARAFFDKKMPPGKTTLKSLEIQGDTMSYVLVASDRTIESKTVFHGETSETVKTTKGPNGTETTTIKSRRVGPCS